LAAHLDDALVSPRRLNHLGTVFDPMGHGLFDVDVLAGTKRIEHHRQVPVIWCGNDHGVDVLPVEQPLVLSEVRRDLAVGAFLGPRELAMVTIAGLYQVCLPGLLGGFEQNIASNPETKPRLTRSLGPAAFGNAEESKLSQFPFSIRPRPAALVALRSMKSRREDFGIFCSS